MSAATFPIYKNVIPFGCNTFRDRLIVKTFSTDEARHQFLNKQYDNSWRMLPVVFGGLVLPTKSGTYARAGGAWHNVKKLDPSVLAHC